MQHWTSSVSGMCSPSTFIFRLDEQMTKVWWANRNSRAQKSPQRQPQFSSLFRCERQICVGEFKGFCGQSWNVCFMSGNSCLLARIIKISRWKGLPAHTTAHSPGRWAKERFKLKIATGFNVGWVRSPKLFFIPLHPCPIPNPFGEFSSIQGAARSSQKNHDTLSKLLKIWMNFALVLPA